MRLNLDCIRDILLFVEDGIDSKKVYVTFEDLVSTLDTYDRNTLYYHVNQISKHDFVDNVFYADNQPQLISDLTPGGHAFLANIRSNSVWNQVKSICLKLGVFSLSNVVQIASSVTADLITNHFTR